MPYEKNGTDLVSIDEILSHYLWNQQNAPSPKELNDDKWIRDKDAIGNAIVLDTNKYMSEGAGRFVSAADFTLFRDFFSHDMKSGNYDFSSMWNILRSGRVDPSQNKELNPDGTKKYKFETVVSQYTKGIGSNDYLTRAFIFGSTSFTIDFNTIQFVVNPDGSKEIRGLKIIPIEDNFDFVSNNFAAEIFNNMKNSTIDPSGIGRKVPIKFSDSDNVPPVIVTEKDFERLTSQKEEADGHYAEAILYYNAISDAINNSPSIAHIDNEERWS